MESRIAICIVSGGMDSVTLAYLAKSRGYQPHLVSFDYGQRHRRELDFAARCALDLSAPHDILDLTSVGARLTGSALTEGGIAVPEGHYAAPTMRLTVVPNRNAIMLAIAYGLAVARGAELVATGVHAGDHAIYPDCRPDFIEAFGQMEQRAVEGFGNPLLQIWAPFVDLGKHDIVTEGAALGVPFERTWSCYNGRDFHCGKCGTCVERQEAFALAGVADPTVYEVPI